MAATAAAEQVAWARSGTGVTPIGGAAPGVCADGMTAPEAETVRPLWLDRGRIPVLDGLRALSIALVFVEHGCKAVGFHAPGVFRPLVGRIGTVGVDTFFAISGFLITL